MERSNIVTPLPVATLLKLQTKSASADSRRKKATIKRLIIKLQGMTPRQVDAVDRMVAVLSEQK